jgi:hypothetical protein
MPPTFAARIAGRDQAQPIYITCRPSGTGRVLACRRLRSIGCGHHGRAGALAGQLGHKMSGLLLLEAAPIWLAEEVDELLVVGTCAAPATNPTVTVFGLSNNALAGTSASRSKHPARPCASTAEALRSKEPDVLPSTPPQHCAEAQQLAFTSRRLDGTDVAPIDDQELGWRAHPRPVDTSVLARPLLTHLLQRSLGPHAGWPCSQPPGAPAAVACS